MEYFTVQEISDKLKIPVVTVRQYLRDGDLKGVKLGKHWRISDEQLKEFLDKHTTN